MENTELIEKVAHLEEREKSNTKRINEHDEQIKELNNVYLALTKVDDKVTNVESDVSEIKQDLKDIKEKPIKEYENTKYDVKKQVISFVIGIILTFLAFKLGLTNFL